MDAETLVLAVLDAVPDEKIQGRKRLQKMSYFKAFVGIAVQISPSQI